jgi:hypothetical protein
MDENYIKEIYQDIQIKLTAIHDTEFDNLILYTIVLSSLISRIRNIQFNDSINEIIKRINTRTRKLGENQIQIELDKLFMKNDENISILYNLSYLDTLAESFNYKKVAHICKIQKSKFMNRIVELVISSNK